MTIIASVVPHPPSESCGMAHCYIHDVDEDAGRGPGDEVRVCFECKHVYGSRYALWEALVELRGGRDTDDDIDELAFCPLCLHDFL